MTLNQSPAAEVIDAELLDEDQQALPAVREPLGLDLSGFHRDTVLVAGQPLPQPLAPDYSLADFVISPETEELLKAARRHNTARNKDNQVSLFQRWCAQRNRVALPCTTATLIEYVGWMIRSGTYDPNTVQVYSSAVVTWQERETPGHTRPGTLQIREMISAFRTNWSKTNTEKQSPAVREADLEVMLAVCDERGRPADLRDAAILTLGFHLLTRRIELAQLLVIHLVLERDGMHVRLVDRKTRKDGSVYEGWVPARDDAPHLCPVRRMRTWLEYGRRIHQPADQAAFRALDKAGRLAVRLTPQTRPKHPNGTEKKDEELTPEDWTKLSMLSGEAINGYVKAKAKAAERKLAHLSEVERADLGYNALLNAPTAAKVTAHGLRAGGATELKEGGVPEDQISELGDWAKGSKAMQRYFRKIHQKANNPWAVTRQLRGEH
ncbi:hypothetical protein [Kitasatospora sp. NPDC085464]|uniref:hypothetical protein n=1 Tax=Kitasatospora sp. NPDC085464 TaxID=3364063 RepID=UPI0037CA60DC